MPTPKPTSTHPGDLVGTLADDKVGGELAALIDTANGAMDPVLANRSVWIEEAARQDAQVLTWPPVMEPADGLTEFLCKCACDAVDNVLNARARAQGLPDGSVHVPDDTENENFQLVLRVCKRAVEAADAAIRKDFAKAGRIDGKRAVEGYMIRKHIEYLQRTERLSVTDAAKKIGISPAAAYRWLGKK